jgi:biotin transport system substrate-specific component
MSNLTLASRIWPSSTLLRNVALAVFGSLLVAAAAQITVPMWPVPMTLQTLAVLGIGAAYGARLGAATLGLYASSMGYVVGFIIAAYLVGKLVESGWANTLFKSALATLAGAAVLYVPGVIWLGVWASTTGIVPEGQTAVQAALSWGLYPFLIGDAVKAVIAGLAVPAAGLLFNRKA